jgi:hypothetical protein
VLEAMLELEKGKNLDLVLEDFARVSAETYHRLGADRLPIPSEIIVPKGKKP